jgi:hypothetical protein
VGVDRYNNNVTWKFRVLQRPTLVDHESYWTAYRTPRSRLLRISGTKGVNPQGSFRPRVAFLAATGDVLREETIHRFVAG